MTDLTLDAIQQQIIGYDREVPLATGGSRRYVYLDNAASTPALAPVKAKVDEFLEWYSSIHRGTGFKSTVATHAYERAREVVLEFVGADRGGYTAVFTVNTTEAVNKLSCCLPWERDAVVLVSPLEHHSNELPWRRQARVEYLPVGEDWRIDLAAAEKKMAELGKRLKLVAVTGASNVTGQLTPVHELARLAHRHGARILVDAAQLAPHSPVEMNPAAAEAGFDFLVLAGHKMYAPFGGAALVGSLAALDPCRPACVGGGTVKLVTRRQVEWAGLPDRLEAGTPNVVGAVALAAAALTLRGLGYDALREHEHRLTARLLTGLASTPGVSIYGPADPARLDNRLGVITFNLEDCPHALTAAVLSFEGGIGVRNGCFCAHPFVTDLLRVDPAEFEVVAAEMLGGDRRRVPGMVRVSLGIYNTEEEVDHFLSEVRRLAEHGPRLRYEQNVTGGEFTPVGYSTAPERYFDL